MDKTEGLPRLRPSAAHRWVRCPGSVKAEIGYPKETSDVADEGTLAHEVCEVLLKCDGELPTCHNYPEEMVKAAYGYKNYIDSCKDEFADIEKFFIEKKVKNIYMYDRRPILDAGGTVDAALLGAKKDGTILLHIFDYKYGFNKVEAYKNYQLLLYSVGLWRHEIGMRHEPEDIEVVLHVYQPRIKSYLRWQVPNFGESVRSMEAAMFGAIFSTADNLHPSKEACKWCRARFDCSARLGQSKTASQISKKTIISKKDRAYILDNAASIRKFLDDTEQKAIEELNNGGHINGYKLTHGRSTTKVKEEGEKLFYAAYGDQIYKRSLLPVSKLKEIVDEELFKCFTYKTEGRLKIEKDETNLEWNNNDE